MTKGNPSKTAEQQIARDLIFKGIEPDYIPPDRIMGKDVTDVQLGVDGPFKPDSEIRRHVTGRLDADGMLNLDRSDTRTEILSPEAVEDTFNKWKQDAVFNKSGQNQDSRFHFNTAAGEYHGQQI